MRLNKALALFILLVLSTLSAAERAAEPPTPTADPTSRDVFKKGVMAFQQKQYDKAVEALIKVPELGGYLSLYKHWFLGQSYLELGKYQPAEVEFSKLLSGQASTELQYQAQFLLADTAIRQKKYAEAVTRLTKLEKKWRRSYRFPEVLYRLMVADLKLNRAASLCRRARKLYADYPANFLVVHWGSDLRQVEIEGRKLPCQATRGDFSDRIRSLQWAGESDKAHREITELLARAPASERVSLDLILANFLVNEGSVDDALNNLIRYYPQQKQNMGYLVLLGKAAARSGEYQTAVGAYERAYGISPGSRKGREALYQAAYLSYQFQDYDGAVRKFQKFIKANPKSGLAKDAQWHLAWLQYLRSDYKGALQKFEEVRKATQSKRKHSDSLQERLMYWIAMSHIRLKQWNDAAKAFESIVSKNAYSFYSLAAQARLESIKGKLDEQKVRVPTALRAVPLDGAPDAAEAQSRESEEDLAEPAKDEPAPVAVEEGGETEGIQASNFKDPALRARIDVATNLIALGLEELARWELIEVEKHTRNSQYLRMLISAYEKISSFHRSAAIAELSFGRERESAGMDGGRALWQSTFPQAFKPWVTKYSASAGANPEWVWSIMRAESLYKPDVISPVGARGLLQLMPYTARNLARLAGDSAENAPNTLDPETNIRLGAQYLARLKQKFKGNLPLAAAAYNAGPHRVEGWLVNFGHLETDEFIEHIPFLETRNYVKKVVRNHTFYRRLYAKDQATVGMLAKGLGVPIPSRAATRESWDSL
jgi:soluble lytic murein transglycosylase